MTAKSPITTHVLNTASGRPASGVKLKLNIWRESEREWIELAEGTTNSDGRVMDLLPAGSKLEKAVYQIIFFSGDYFSEKKEKCFYPRVPVVFEVTDPAEHHHVPLLISPFGFSTYRGS